VEQIRIAIVDDEPLARERIRSLLLELPEVDVVAEAANGREAIDVVRRYEPDLVFLDVQMPEIDGFGVLQHLELHERPRGVIFVTAYDRYAIQAFEVNAIDYLLKPYSRERFNAAVTRARSRLERPQPAEGPHLEALLAAIAAKNNAPERLAIKSKDGVEFVRIADIDWIAADGNYAKVNIGAASARVRETISDLEERLRPAGFMRVHRSIIVNADRILRVEPWANGEYLIILRNGTKVNSGRGYGEQIRALFR